MLGEAFLASSLEEGSGLFVVGVKGCAAAVSACFHFSFDVFCAFIGGKFMTVGEASGAGPHAGGADGAGIDGIAGGGMNPLLLLCLCLCVGE